MAKRTFGTLLLRQCYDVDAVHDVPSITEVANVEYAIVGPLQKDEVIDLARVVARSSDDNTRTPVHETKREVPIVVKRVVRDVSRYGRFTVTALSVHELELHFIAKHIANRFEIASIKTIDILGKQRPLLRRDRGRRRLVPLTR